MGEWTFGFVVGFISSCVLAIAAYCSGNERVHAIKVEAVENHHARWITSVEGESKFEWIEVEGKK